MQESKNTNIANDSKRTVGVVTMYRKNYGAFLQAYALQQSLESFGFRAELLRYDYYNDGAICTVPIQYLITNPILFFKKLLLFLVRFKTYKERDNVFLRSVNKNLKESAAEYKNYKKLRQTPPVYDIYLTGSDQVFNPNLTPIATGSRLLEFVEGVKVSYAASAGKIAFTEKQKQRLLFALKKFDTVSVREESLKEYLTKNGCCNVRKDVDPTLLLEKKQWSQFAVIPNELQDKQYIFYYHVANDDTLLPEAERLSGELNLPIYVGDNKRSFKNQIVRERPLSPEEWVGGIMNAKYIVTNSFHGSVFSIIFNKKVCIKLCGYPERLINLLKDYHLERLLEPKIIDESEIKEIYRYFEEKILQDRKKSFSYLKKL